MKNKEIKLLNLLSENARYSNKHISSKLKITPQGVSYAKKQLEIEHNLLYTTIIDSAIFSYTHLLVGIDIPKYSEKDKKAVLQIIKQYPEVITIWEGDYETDYIAEFCTKNLAEFAKINAELVTQFQQSISIQFVYPIISKSIKLTDKKERIELLQDQKKSNLTQTTIDVLKAFQRNPIISKNHIAKEIGKSITSITNAKKELEKKDIIKGYSVISNHTERKHIFILLRFKSSQNQIDIKDHPVINKSARNVIKTIGFYNCCIIIESIDATKAIKELRKDFVIDKHIVIPIAKVHKYQFSNIA